MCMFWCKYYSHLHFIRYKKSNEYSLQGVYYILQIVTQGQYSVRVYIYIYTHGQHYKCSLVYVYICILYMDSCVCIYCVYIYIYIYTWLHEAWRKSAGGGPTSGNKITVKGGVLICKGHLLISKETGL